MFANGPISRELLVNVESSTNVVANVCDVDTWTRYLVAPVIAPHAKIVFTGTLVEASAGNVRDGESGAATIVAKLRTAENALVPPAFDALTRQ